MMNRKHIATFFLLLMTTAMYSQVGIGGVNSTSSPFKLIENNIDLITIDDNGNIVLDTGTSLNKLDTKSNTPTTSLSYAPDIKIEHSKIFGNLTFDGLTHSDTTNNINNAILQAPFSTALLLVRQIKASTNTLDNNGSFRSIQIADPNSINTINTLDITEFGIDNTVPYLTIPAKATYKIDVTFNYQCNNYTYSTDDPENSNWGAHIAIIKKPTASTTFTIVDNIRSIITQVIGKPVTGTATSVLDFNAGDRVSFRVQPAFSKNSVTNCQSFYDGVNPNIIIRILKVGS